MDGLFNINTLIETQSIRFNFIIGFDRGLYFLKFISHILNYPNVPLSFDKSITVFQSTNNECRSFVSIVVINQTLHTLYQLFCLTTPKLSLSLSLRILFIFLIDHLLRYICNI